MKIAILSDVHENSHNLILALKTIEEKECEQILFLGDFMNNGIAKFFASFKIPTFAVWGNNDGERAMITKTSLTPGSNLTVSDSVYDFVEFEGKKIFITHYPDIARSMAKSGDFDAVFCGHSHEKSEEKIGNCLLVNPGEISAHKTGEATFAIWDTEENKVEFITLENSITLLTKEVEEFRKNIDFVYSHTKRHKK